MTIYIPAITGTSNSALFSYTGLPAALYTARQHEFRIPRATNNGTDIYTAEMFVYSASGEISFFQQGGSSWTTSGTKAIATEFDITYTLQ